MGKKKKRGLITPKFSDQRRDWTEASVDCNISNAGSQLFLEGKGLLNLLSPSNLVLTSSTSSSSSFVYGLSAFTLLPPSLMIIVTMVMVVAAASPSGSKLIGYQAKKFIYNSQLILCGLRSYRLHAFKVRNQAWYMTSLFLLFFFPSLILFVLDG